MLKISIGQNHCKSFITETVIFRPHWFKPLSNWSKNNAEPSLTQNDVKFQCSVFIFLSRGFHAFVLTKFALSLLSTLSCPYLKLISISNDSLTFQSKYLFFMERVWGVTIQIGSGISLCIPWHSGCSRDDQLHLILSCWCSIDLLMIFFFVSPLYTDPHEHTCTIHGSYLVLTYPCFYIKYSLS